jgi:hypothetical protein
MIVMMMIVSISSTHTYITITTTTTTVPLLLRVGALWRGGRAAALPVQWPAYRHKGKGECCYDD